MKNKKSHTETAFPVAAFCPWTDKTESDLMV